MNSCTEYDSFSLGYFFWLIRKISDDQALYVIACDTFGFEGIHSHNGIDQGLMVHVI